MRLQSAVFIAVFAIPCAAQAQTDGWSGPSWGFVYDQPTRSIRPLMGIPGSGYLGAPAVTEVDSAWISPAGNSAVAEQAGSYVLYRNLKQPEPMPLSTRITRVDLAAWAQDSSVFVAWSAQERVLERWTAAGAHTSADLVMPEGEPTELVAGPGAEVIVAVVHEAEATAFYSVQKGGAAALITRCGKGARAAFSPAGDVLYLADGSARQLLSVRSISDAPQIEVLLADDGIAGVGVLAALDRGRVCVISIQDKAARIYDTASGALAAEIPVEGDSPQLLRLRGENLFLVQSRNTADSSLFVLDTRMEPSVYFVPDGPHE